MRNWTLNIVALPQTFTRAFAILVFSLFFSGSVFAATQAKKDAHKGKPLPAEEKVEAVKKWEGESAAKIFPSTLNNLEDTHRDSQAIPQDYEEAMKRFKKAADQGDAYGQNGVGIMYRDGLGVLQNYAEAMRWFRKAADQGDAEGQNGIGTMYQRGLGVLQDYAEAKKWYAMSAAKGFPSAQNNLGYLHYKGLGVPQSSTEAMKWFRKAAEQGDAEGQNWTGFMYREGKGIPKNYAEAMKWFKKAAEQGDMIGQTWVGSMYRDGLGVPQDHAEARKWFEMAAAKGDPVAKESLAKLDVLEKKTEPVAVVPPLPAAVTPPLVFHDMPSASSVPNTVSAAMADGKPGQSATPAPAQKSGALSAVDQAYIKCSGIQNPRNRVECYDTLGGKLSVNPKKPTAPGKREIAAPLAKPTKHSRAGIVTDKKEPDKTQTPAKPAATGTAASSVQSAESAR